MSEQLQVREVGEIRLFGGFRGMKLIIFQELLRLWRLVWDFLTILLVGVDAVMLPVLLAWPAEEGTGWDDYYKVRKRM